jgi:hypothetical protein
MYRSIMGSWPKAFRVGLRLMRYAGKLESHAVGLKNNNL